MPYKYFFKKRRKQRFAVRWGPCLLQVTCFIRNGTEPPTCTTSIVPHAPAPVEVHEAPGNTRAMRSDRSRVFPPLGLLGLAVPLYLPVASDWNWQAGGGAGAERAGSPPRGRGAWGRGRGRRKDGDGKIPGDCGRDKGRNRDIRMKRGRQREKIWTAEETQTMHKPLWKKEKRMDWWWLIY